MGFTGSISECSDIQVDQSIQGNSSQLNYISMPNDGEFVFDLGVLENRDVEIDNYALTLSLIT